MSEYRNENSLETDSLSSVESPEVLWQAVGLLDPPVESEPSVVADAKQSLLEQGHVHRRLRASAGGAIESWPLNPSGSGRASSRRRSYLPRVAVVAALLFGMAFLGVRVVEARRDRIANEGYAVKALGFALDLYEEDVVRLESDAAALQANLPTASGWSFDAVTHQQAEACSKALVGLSAVRRGQPFAALSELKECLAAYESLEENARVPIMNSPFDIIVGVTCLEALRMLGQRGKVHSPEFEAIVGVEPGFRAAATARVHHAIEDLQLELTNYPVENRELLLCALLADLARYTSYKAVGFDDLGNPLPAEERARRLEQNTQVYKRTLDYLKQASRVLESLPVRGQRWWSQFAHVLNIRMLVETRYCFLDGIPAQHSSNVERMDFWSKQTQLIADFVNQLPSDEGRAVRFELAICYSNWADWYRDKFIFEYPTRIAETDIERHRVLRQQALRILEVAPRQIRTERYVENLALNYARGLYVNAAYAQQQGAVDDSLPELKEQATRLHLLIGDLLDAEIGQVSSPEAILAARLLPEIFPADRVDEYVQDYRNNPRIFSETVYQIVESVEKELSN